MTGNVIRGSAAQPRGWSADVDHWIALTIQMLHSYLEEA